MAIRVIISCFFIIKSVGLFAQQTINGSFEHDGIQRTYILYVPDVYSGNESVPLVLNFHGRTSDALSQMNYGDFRSISDRENFLIVHPQGTLDPTGTTFWNAQWFENGVDDIGFTSALIDDVANSYNIDLNRVYSTGMSNGGFMSHTLACELADEIAAVASVTGTMTTSQVNQSCDPAQLTPVMEIHGTADGVVPYEGDNVFMAAIDEVIAHWIEQNNCNEIPLKETLPDLNNQDGSTVERYLYSDCDEDSTVELFKVIAGGHTWPGTIFPFGVTNQDINASEEIWRFFSQYDLNGKISSSQVEMTQSLVKIYPNPVMDQLNVSFSSAQQRKLSLTCMDATFQRVEYTSSQNLNLSMLELPNGIYLLQIQEGDMITTERIVKL